MIHIAIDTSALEDNKSLNDANYKALKRLVNANKITVHVPHIVKREIETQEKEYYLEKFSQLQKSLRVFDKIRKSDELYAKINQMKNEIEQLNSDIYEDAERFSKAWVEGLNSIVCELDQTQTKEAWEAYFNGKPPLTSKKQRLDIPDSFICRGIEKIQNDIGDLVVLAKDKKIFNTFNNNEKIKIYRTIREFISSEEMQTELVELDTITGTEIVQNRTRDLLGFINKYESSTSLIKHYLESHIGEHIVDSQVNDVPYSNESDGEATISSYYDGQNVQLNLAKPTHYGENQLGFEFGLEVEVYIQFFIDKSDYYMEFYHDDEITPDFSVEDWNDHVYLAEQTVNLKVTGTVSIEIDTSNIDFVEIAQCDDDELDDYFNDIFCESKIKIESIEEMELI